MTSIFTFIALVMRLFKVWDQFVDFVDTARALEAEKKRAALAQAVDDTEKVKTPEDAYANQDRIVDNKP